MATPPGMFGGTWPRLVHECFAADSGSAAGRSMASLSTSAAGSNEKVAAQHRYDRAPDSSVARGSVHQTRVAALPSEARSVKQRRWRRTDLSETPCEKQDDDDDQDDAHDTDATMTVAVTVAAEAAAEATEQEYDEDDNENGTKRHAKLSLQDIRVRPEPEVVERRFPDSLRTLLRQC